MGFLHSPNAPQLFWCIQMHPNCFVLIFFTGDLIMTENSETTDLLIEMFEVGISRAENMLNAPSASGASGE